jgi:hypothetical protein
MRTIIHAVVLGGRRIQPAALAITLAAIALFFTYIGRQRVDGPWENVLAALAAATAILLSAGWALNRHGLMRAGLLLSVAMWCFTSWIAAVGLGALTSFLLALAWTVLAAGSYWLEEVEAQAVRRGSP